MCLGRSKIDLPTGYRVEVLSGWLDLWIWGSGQNLCLEIPLQSCAHSSGTAPSGREKNTSVGPGLTGGGEEPAEETRLGSQRTQKIRQWGVQEGTWPVGGGLRRTDQRCSVQTSGGLGRGAWRTGRFWPRGLLSFLSLKGEPLRLLLLFLASVNEDT